LQKFSPNPYQLIHVIDMEESLVEIAKSEAVRALSGKVVIKKAHIDLALAWVNDEITLTQAALALGKVRSHNAQVYSVFARALKEYLKYGADKP